LNKLRTNETKLLPPVKPNLPYCASAAKQCENLQTWTVQKGRTVK